MQEELEVELNITKSMEKAMVDMSESKKEEMISLALTNNEKKMKSIQEQITKIDEDSNDKNKKADHLRHRVIPSAQRKLSELQLKAKMISNELEKQSDLIFGSD